MFSSFQERSKNEARLNLFSSPVIPPVLPLSAPLPVAKVLTGVDLARARMLIHRYGGAKGYAQAVKRAPQVKVGERCKAGVYSDRVVVSNLDNPTKVDWVRRMRGRCLRCGLKGHRADTCREPSLCFNCRHTGHNICRCPKITKPRSTFSLSTTVSSSSSSQSEVEGNPSSISISSPSLSDHSSSAMELVPRKIKEDDEISEKLKELPRSIVIQADESISLLHVMCEIGSHFPADQFRVAKLSLNRYHIVGPSVAWRDAQFSVSYFEVTIGKKRRFCKILKEAPELEPSTKLERYWVRIVDIPYGWRSWYGLEQLVFFGFLHRPDYTTHLGIEGRWLRVQIDVGDRYLIPDFAWYDVEYKSGRRDS